ncbi:uncharacterized protein FIBRA_03884 [Fibroporia radiculosa]|uniref:Protein kinase domain-containing protein n=1 Tax=Fibroporia radiculosa TaxID=599839 RepID=J4I9V4_9APHY|nr:uncharacterized protein FIBRA_03884 [Fibroporia radiculosa]CCM01816.1 predicted protein [Fibroporia radiculosa]
MAAAVLSSSKLSISNPFSMVSHRRSDAPSPLPSSAASSSKLHSSGQGPSAPEVQPKTFKRLRSSLEQSLRTATKSKAKASVSLDESAVLVASESKGKERASEDHIVPQEKDKSRSRMLSKVSFRRPVAGKEASSPPPVPAVRLQQDSEHGDKGGQRDKHRVAGTTSFQTPSLRQASMSSPALPIPSAYTQPFALPSTSSSNLPALVSSPRERSRKSDAQASISTRNISGPTPLTPKRDSRLNSAASSSPTREKHRPSALTLSRNGERISPRSPETPTRRSREHTRSPDLPPSPTPQGMVGLTSRRAAASASNLALRASPSPPPSPTPSPMSAIRARSSSRTPTPRAAPSASSSHLPLSSTSFTSISAGRPSLDAGRPSLESRRPSADTARPSLEARRPSVDTARPSFEARRPSADLRRPSLDVPRSSLDGRRPSLDQRPVPLSSSPPSRAASPSTPPRTRAISPSHRSFSPNYYQGRLQNASTTSLLASSPEHREQIRSASSYLCKEMLKPPSQLNKSSLQPREWEEVEVRMRGLARLERVWGKSGAGMGSSSQLSSVGVTSSGLSAGGEEREKRFFGDALRDGYVLCQLMNKLFPALISRVDPREDGLMRMSNVTKFIAACSSVGVRPEDLFHRDDLIESSAECLARVARTVIALQKLAESPAPEKSIQGGGNVQSGQSPGPYGSGAGSRGAASTPNLASAQMQRSTSPVGPHTPGRKRWSPPQPLPTLRSDSPIEEGSASSSDGKATVNGKVARDRGTPGGSDIDEVPPIISPPPRSPLRPRASIERASMADSTLAMVGDSVRGSMVDSIASVPMRQSQASSYMTDMTVLSSLLEVQRTSSAGYNKFGTIRTVTTEATSVDVGETPSLTFTEGSSMAASLAEEFGRKRPGEVPSRPSRERRPSETALNDLTRVVEETEEGSASSKAAKASKKAAERRAEADKEKQPKSQPIKLGKGKWPDDFLDAFSAQKNPLLDEDEVDMPASRVPLSASPPRKLAYIGASRADASVESLSPPPRRPVHRSRHSIDTPGLLPKDSLLRRDSSPDAGLAQPSSPRIVLRRNSSKAGHHRNGMYIPRSSSHSQDSESRVPFPRTVSAEHGTPPAADPPARVSSPAVPESKQDVYACESKPRQPRGRFQSEIEGSSARRKARPNSVDDLGAQPRRSRFESMVNLGVATGNASASDLITRDSYEGSAVRQTLIVKEEGKPPTQFQLGNCIGRGQFGAVYRALNLNTGQMVAVKRIRLEGLKEDEIKQLMKEVDLVKSLSHPSIVKYEGMARDNDTLSIVLEYAENGSLGQTLKAFGKLNERLVAGYVVKILEGLHYLHQSDVVHCDLKAANILTTKNGNVKLSDFGVSLNLRAMEREMKDVAGTPNWMAPEVIELKGASTKSDIWSLACTVIELLTGRPPYAEIANSMSVMFRIVEDNMPPLPDGCSDSLQDFLRRCFNKDPSMRPSAEMLCEHEWLKKNWALHNQELRPQDSIPFLRRVSADYQNQRADIMRYLANVEMPESDRATPELRPRIDNSPCRRRMSNDPESFSPREHSFVRTTFGKPVICRVCNQSVKKSAVLCEQCSLISHVKCAPNAPPSCDLRTQLLLYAQYAESSSPGGQYSDPMELLAALQTNGPALSDGDLTPRTSMDSTPPHLSPLSSHPHPPTAYKVLQAFKRSRSFLTDQDRSSALSMSAPTSPVPSSSQTPERRQVTQKRSILRRKSDVHERPQSISSESTSQRNSSVRSAVTAAESLNSTTRRSIISTEGRNGVEKSVSRFSQATTFSIVSAAETEREDSGAGVLNRKSSKEKHRDRDSKSSNSGCTVQ